MSRPPEQLPGPDSESPAAPGGKSPRGRLVLCGIIGVALALRLSGAWRGNLMFDESAHIAVAETIDLRPSQFHLVSRTLDHPLLSVYVLKLSSLLFGESNFGFRLLHILAGTATAIAVFLLGRRVYSESAGLWAAALLSADQFHASWSRFPMPEVLMLFFWSVSLLQLLRAVSQQNARAFVILGAFWGLAYLAKETGVLLLPVAWLFLLVTPDQRHLLWSFRWYLAHAVFLIVIAPDLAWNLLHFDESYLQRDAQMLSEGFQIQFKPFSLFLGELFRELIDKDLLDVDYDQGNAFACHWPAGLLYLVSTVVMIRWRGAPERLLVVSFLFVFVLFLFVPGGEPFDPFWWSSPTLIPAIVFAGRLLDRIAARRLVWRVAGVTTVVYLTLHLVPVLLRPGGPGGQGYPRRSVDEFAAISVLDAQDAIRNNRPEIAEKRLIYALNIAGADPIVYYNLAYAHAMQGHDAVAVRYLNKCLELSPEVDAARRLLAELEERQSSGTESVEP